MCLISMKVVGGNSSYSTRAGGLLSPGGKVAIAGPDQIFVAPDWHRVDVSLPQCVANSWADDNRLLCTWGQQIKLITFSSDYSQATVADLLPANTRTNSYVTASPDGTQAAFLSKDVGKPWALYRIALGPDSQPHKVIDLPDTQFFQLLDWR
jgi:dipeptidyl aminopeptidase/acylaminoacyl peptidase